MTEMNSDGQEITKPAKPNQAWMITFADLVSLMLTFFVLLFSMSTLKIDEWDAMIDTLTQTLNPSKLTTVAAATSKFNIATFLRKPATNLDYLSNLLQRAMAEDPMLQQSQLMLLDDRLVIAMPGDLMFPPGGAVIPADSRSALFTLGGVLSNISNQIGVNGHTDPHQPASESDYASNWELSLARSVAVANALKRAGYSEDILAYGYADSRYHQLPDLPSSEREALGRRVDIIIFSTVGGD